MAQIHEVDVNEYIKKLAFELHKEEAVNPPAWAPFVKTGVHRERPPAQEDWWYVRTAAILRKIYLKGPIGTNKLRTLYGGKRNAGMAAEHTKRGGGSIIRKALQQLEKAGLAEQAEKGGHKGRVLTAKGMSFMNKVAKEMQ